MNSTNREPSDSIERDAWVDELCDRFEDAWRTGRAIAVTEFLSAEGIDPATAHPDLLHQLGRVEAAYREPTPADAGGTEGTVPLAEPGAARTDAEFGVGTVLAGKYRLVEEIGGGGMGEVWRARQTEPVKRAVAVKVIKVGMDSAAVLARFEAERQALALMTHEYIAKVYDAGSTAAGAGGRPFFVMELVEGVPITEFCDAHRLTVHERLRLFVRVCEAIQHAHTKGVIHRDIKPRNVLVTAGNDGPVPKVIDFGIAKAAGERLTDHTLATGTGAIVGTPDYMSPEQAAGTGDIDTRSDVYALGVLLYELLTGISPVACSGRGRLSLPEQLRLVHEVDPPRPSQTASRSSARAVARGTDPVRLSRLLRGDVDAVALMALEKDRERRYESARAFAADVERHLANEPVRARPPSRGYRLSKFVRRNRGPVLAGALLLVALVAGTAGTALGLVEAHRQQRETETARATAEAARGWAEDSEATARRERANALAVAAASGLDQAQNVCEGGNVARGLHLMLKALPQAIESGNAAVEDAVRSNIAAWLPHANRVLAHTSGVASTRGVPNCAALAPSGTQMVMGNDKGELCLRDALTGAQIGRAEVIDSAVLQVAWQPGGDQIAVLSRDGQLRLWTAGTPITRARTVRVCPPMNGVPRGALSFGPDGAKLLVGAMGRSVLLVDVARAEIVAPSFLHGSTHCDAVAISPDGTKAVIATPNWSARVYDLATGQPLTPAIRTYGSNFCVGISPDGTKFFTGHHMDASLQVWDLTTGAAVGPRIAPGGPVLTAAFSPDGRHLAIGGWMAFMRVWDWKTGTPVGSPIPGQGHSVAFSADGTRLLVAAYGATVWQLPDRDLAWASQRLPGSVHGFAIRPDGEEFALTMSNAFTRDSDGTQTPFLRRYKVSNGEPIRPFLPTPHGRFAPSLRYTPDGKTIYCSQDRGVTEYSLTAGREVRRLIHPDPKLGYGSIDLTSDGRYLAVGGNGHLAVYDRTREEWVQKTSYEKHGGSGCGFLPGTHTVVDFTHGKLLAWDIDTPNFEPVTRYATALAYCTSWGARADGRALAVMNSVGNLVEHDLTTNRPTGLAFGNLMSAAPLYSPDGRWLYLGDQTGYAARHRATRKRLGPYYTDIDGNGLGITPNGKHLITVDTERRLHCWRVPVPVTGTPDEVTRRVVERIGIVEEQGEFLTVRPPARAESAPVAAPPFPVFDFRELHGADIDELKKWFAALPKTYRPTHITVQEGSGGKRFNALAVDDGTATVYDPHLAINDVDNADGRPMWAKGWQIAINTLYFPGGPGLRHHVWTKGPRHDTAWFSAKEVEKTRNLLRERRMRPVGIAHYDEGLFVHGGSVDGPPWELHADLTATQVKQKLDECRTRKWRPDLIHRHRTEADKFVLVTVDNPHDTPWEYDAALPVAEYEKKLAACRARGFRPHSVHSWLANGSAVYSALWLGDYKPLPVKPELAPPPRAK